MLNFPMRHRGEQAPGVQHGRWYCAAGGPTPPYQNVCGFESHLHFRSSFLFLPHPRRQEVMAQVLGSLGPT